MIGKCSFMHSISWSLTAVTCVATHRIPQSRIDAPIAESGPWHFPVRAY
jgi:hypothetical protein